MPIFGNERDKSRNGEKRLYKALEKDHCSKKVKLLRLMAFPKFNVTERVSFIFQKRLDNTFYSFELMGSFYVPLPFIVFELTRSCPCLEVGNLVSLKRLEGGFLLTLSRVGRGKIGFERH